MDLRSAQGIDDIPLMSFSSKIFIIGILPFFLRRSDCLSMPDRHSLLFYSLMRFRDGMKQNLHPNSCDALVFFPLSSVSRLEWSPNPSADFTSIFCRSLVTTVDLCPKDSERQKCIMVHSFLSVSSLSIRCLYHGINYCSSQFPKRYADRILTVRRRMRRSSFLQD